MKKMKNEIKENKDMKQPFFGFYPAEDICKCSNTKCKKRIKCFRYMGGNTEWQSVATFGGGKSCFLPYYVWGTSDGKKLMLKEIKDDHLKNIIIHLFERAQVIFDEEPGQGEGYLAALKYAENSIKIAKEFIKEARIRKIYK